LAHTARRTEVRHVVFLDRQPGAQAQLRRVSKQDAVRRLASTNHYGTEHVAKEKVRSLDRISDGGLFEMKYADLTDAIGCLDSLVGAG
jgi:hypothetical protein